MKPMVLLILAFLTLNCSQQKTTENQNDQTENVINEQVKIIYQPIQDSLFLPLFIDSLFNIFKNELYIYYHDEIMESFPDEVLDSNMMIQLLRLNFFHDLFTNSGAYNGNTDGILKFNYYWHWVKPNPRHQIRFYENDKLLVETKPPKGYGNYKTYADIDRLPFILISDAFLETPKYYVSVYDSIYSFGWCSEKEMAFNCFLDLFGFSSKVVAQNNHSWSEVMLDYQNEDGSKLIVKIDNTFDMVSYYEIEKDKISNWADEELMNKSEKWYNKKAHQQDDLSKLKTLLVGPVASKRIFESLMVYTDGNQNCK